MAMALVGVATAVGTLAVTAIAASAQTDSVYVYDYPTNVNEPLPAGTPDVVTPLTTALLDVCAATGNGLAVSDIGLCFSEYPYPVGPPPFIVAQAGNAGVVLPPGCGVAIFAYPDADGSTTLVGAGPPGNNC
jgi:hypothetical protein